MGLLWQFVGLIAQSSVAGNCSDTAGLDGGDLAPLSIVGNDNTEGICLGGHQKIIGQPIR